MHSAKRVSINFMVKEHNFKHLKFTFSQTLFETVFDANKKLLARKENVKQKVVCSNSKENNKVINMIDINLIDINKLSERQIQIALANIRL